MINQSRSGKPPDYALISSFLWYARYKKRSYSSYHIHIELTIQTLLNNLHMQQAPRNRTEPKIQRGGTLRLESQGRPFNCNFSNDARRFSKSSID